MPLGTFATVNMLASIVGLLLGVCLPEYEEEMPLGTAGSSVLANRFACQSMRKKMPSGRVGSCHSSAVGMLARV